MQENRLAQPDDRIIRIENLSVRLDNRTVLDGLNLAVRSGTRMLISGRNGAGKTTLLKIIVGLIQPLSGTSRVNLGNESVRMGTQIAYLNQESIHVDFPISGREVVEIGVTSRGLSRRERRSEILYAMELAGCTKLANRPFAKLSGGEKQKVSLARCFAQDPTILLLDEPCGSLDADAKADILGILEDYNGRLGTSVLMVSHDEDIRYREGWIHMHMEHGRLKEQVSG